jgi:hypothetical protein
MKDADLWRDLFPFSIYAGGLRFSDDVIELQYNNFNEEEQRIKKVIRKKNRKIANRKCKLHLRYFE